MYEILIQAIDNNDNESLMNLIVNIEYHFQMYASQYWECYMSFYNLLFSSIYTESPIELIEKRINNGQINDVIINVCIYFNIFREKIFDYIQKNEIILDDEELRRIIVNSGKNNKIIEYILKNYKNSIKYKEIINFYINIHKITINDIISDFSINFDQFYFIYNKFDYKDDCKIYIRTKDKIVKEWLFLHKFDNYNKIFVIIYNLFNYKK